MHDKIRISFMVLTMCWLCTLYTGQHNQDPQYIGLDQSRSPLPVYATVNSGQTTSGDRNYESVT